MVAKSKDHVSDIERLLRRVEGDGREKEGRSGGGSVVKVRVRATGKMGASIVYRVWARNLRKLRAAGWDHWRRITYERSVVKAILKRVLLRRSKMQLIMAWYLWINRVRDRKVKEMEGKGIILEKQMKSQIDNQYNSFVSKIEYIQRENELIHAKVAAKSAMDATVIMDELRNELGKVNDELGEVKMRHQVSERELRRVREVVRDELEAPEREREGGGKGDTGEDASLQQRYAMYQNKYGR